MNRGYIRLWRKFLDGGYVKNHGLCAFMVWCLLKANHEENYETVAGLQRIKLQPGDFVFGRIKAAEETGLSEQAIRTIIAFLKKIKFLTIKSTNKYSIISIINWPLYQAVYEVNQPANQPTTNQQLTTNKNNRTKEKNNMSESDFSNFDVFYKFYPKHEGRQKALEAWNKLRPNQELQQTIMAAVEKQKKQKVGLKSRNEFCPEWPMPATWLNQRRWEDEIPEVKTDSW